MTSTPAPNIVQPQMSPEDDEIDLRQVAAALGRRKNLVASIAGVSVILSGVYAYTRQPVWEGQFQIVLEQQDSGTGGRLAQLAAANPMLANLAGLGGGGRSQLETEVKVLESPSVLKPTYDFVRANKARQGKTSATGPSATGEKTTLRSNWRHISSQHRLPGYGQRLVLPVIKKSRATINTQAEIDPSRSATVLPSPRAG